MKINRRPLPAPHVPFISLADIAWQVIIFFFMAASFTKLDALKIDAPSTAPQAQVQPDKTLTISASEKTLSLDGKTVMLNDLTGELTSRLKDRKKPEQRVVLVEGKDDLSYQRYGELVYSIQKAGATPMISEEK